MVFEPVSPLESLLEVLEAEAREKGYGREDIEREIAAVRRQGNHLRDPEDAAILASVLVACPDVFAGVDKDLHTPEVLALATVHTTAEALAVLEREVTSDRPSGKERS